MGLTRCDKTEVFYIYKFNRCCGGKFGRVLELWSKDRAFDTLPGTTGQWTSYSQLSASVVKLYNWYIDTVFHNNLRDVLAFNRFSELMQRIFKYGSIETTILLLTERDAQFGIWKSFLYGILMCRSYKLLKMVHFLAHLAEIARSRLLWHFVMMVVAGE